MDPATIILELIEALAPVVANLIQKGVAAGLTPAQLQAALSTMQAQAAATFAADDAAAKATEAAKFPGQ
jgi:hypothetical protein